MAVKDDHRSLRPIGLGGLNILDFCFQYMNRSTI